MKGMFMIPSEIIINLKKCFVNHDFVGKFLI